MNLLRATGAGLSEAAYQLGLNIVDVLVQAKNSAVQFIDRGKELVDDYVIHPMPKQQALDILDLRPNYQKRDLAEKFRYLHKANELSPWLQCKIEEAYRVLK